MSHTPQFLIVKYVPDLERMEPRNVGVILWDDGGGAVARFYGEGQEDSTPRAPTFIDKKNRVVYAEWVRYWHRNLAKPALNGVSRESAKFVDAIKRRSRDNYIVVEGGRLTTSINPDERRAALDEIFQRFVGEEPPVVKLKQACDKAIKNAIPREQRETNYPIECLVAGRVTHTFHFNYATRPLGNLVRSLFQRVDLEQEASVNSATLMLQSANDRGMRVDQCGALVVNDALYHPDATEMLRQFGTLINVANADDARYIIRRMSGLNGEPQF
jgi:hypothetical protein